MPERWTLEVEGLTKYYGNRCAVDGVSFKVKGGEVFGFLGPNGAGKTTTIRMLLNLIHPHKGTVRICGFDIDKEPQKAIANVGAIVETPSFYTYLSGYRNLKLMANLAPQVTEQRIWEVLKLVGLDKRAHERVQIYSQGMKQRLGLARALMHNPKLVILDEPTNGLDPQGILEMRNIIQKLAQESGITFFISSHLLHEVEQICDAVGILHKGKLVSTGKVAELLNQEREVVEIGTSSAQDCAEFASQLPFVAQVKAHKGWVEAYVDRGAIPELNRSLVNQGFDIHRLLSRHSSLEEFFVEVTKEEKSRDQLSL